MKLRLNSDPKTVLELTFFVDDLLEAISTADLGEGTPLNPINFDVFVENRLTGIPVIDGGTDIVLELNHDGTSGINPILIYSEMVNITKNYSGYMSESDWNQYFDWSNTESVATIAPNGVLYLTPNDNGVCKITAKANQPDIIISYGAVICFEYNNRMYYGRIDPIAKVSSGGT